MRKTIVIMFILILMIPTLVFANSDIEETSGEFGAISSEFDLEELEFDIKPNEKTKLALNIDGKQNPKEFIQSEFISYPEAINNINVLDLTGKGEGWKLTLEASPLENDVYKFPEGSLSLSRHTGVSNDGMEIDMPEVSFDDGVVIDDGQVSIATAENETGMGSFNIEFDEGSLILAMDNKYSDDVESGEYFTTLNWQLKSADGNSAIIDSKEYVMYVDEEHLIKNVKQSELPDTSGEPLPETATNTFNILLIGTLLLMIGFLFLLMRKKEDEEEDEI